MTRSQIDELSQNLIFLINEMEDVLMKKIAAQLVSDGDVSDSSKWRIRQLARAGKLDKEALKTIKSYMSAQSEMLEDALYSAAVSEIGNVDEMVKDAATRGLVDGRVKAPADRTAQSALKSYLKQAKSDLNMVNTVMRYKTKQAYVSAVNNTFWTLDKEQRVHDALGMGALEVISGAESFQTAVRDVLKKLSERGIPAFIDAGGHEWKPETYVQMDLRTTMGNTARAAQWQRCDDFGVDLIEVDSHLGAREKCARDQGKIYSRSGQSGNCKDGSGNVVYYYALSSTSFGQPDGLFGINCRHNSYPYIPGVSCQRYFPVDEAENAKRYKEYQTQRALERKIRESKRECMLLSEAGDEEGLKKAALTLRNRKENYSAYSKAHDLRVHNDRTQVYGYDRSKSMKTVWAEKKAQSASGGSSAPSGGKAVTVNVPAPASSGKAYTGEKIVKPLDNGGGSGIIKSIDVDDFTMMASSHEIAPEVSNMIANTIREYEKKGGIYISDMHFGNFFDEDTGKPALMQIFQNYYGLTEININSTIMAGKTLDEIDSIIAATKINLPQNLKEAVIHECGHAKAYYGKTPEEVMAMNEQLKDLGVDGISQIAQIDGAECIAEVEVLLSRGEPVSEKAMELYNAYVKGGKRK